MKFKVIEVKRRFDGKESELVLHVINDSQERLDIGDKWTLCSEQYANSHSDDIGYKRGKRKNVSVGFVITCADEGEESLCVFEFSSGADGRGYIQCHIKVKKREFDFLFFHSDITIQIQSVVIGYINFIKKIETINAQERWYIWKDLEKSRNVQFQSFDIETCRFEKLVPRDDVGQVCVLNDNLVEKIESAVSLSLSSVRDADNTFLVSALKPYLIATLVLLSIIALVLLGK